MIKSHHCDMHAIKSSKKAIYSPPPHYFLLQFRIFMLAETLSRFPFGAPFLLGAGTKQQLIVLSCCLLPHCNSKVTEFL